MGLKSIITSAAAASFLFSANVNAQDASEKKVQIGYETINLEKAVVKDYKDYGNSPIVVFIGEYHLVKSMSPDLSEDDARYLELSGRIHNEIYSTLEELLKENSANAVGIEGYWEESITRETLKEMGGAYGVIIDALIEEKNETIKKFMIRDMCFWNGFCPASTAFEMMHDSSVFTFGIETKEIYEEAGELVEKKDEWDARLGELRIISEKKLEELTEEEVKLINDFIDFSKEFAEKYYSLIVSNRSDAFVDNSISFYKDNEADLGEIIVIVGGAAHSDTVAKRLNELKQSYVIVWPESIKEDFMK